MDQVIDLTDCDPVSDGTKRKRSTVDKPIAPGASVRIAKGEWQGLCGVYMGRGHGVAVEVPLRVYDLLQDQFVSIGWVRPDEKSLRVMDDMWLLEEGTVCCLHGSSSKVTVVEVDVQAGVLKGVCETGMTILFSFPDVSVIRSTSPDITSKRTSNAIIRFLEHFGITSHDVPSVLDLHHKTAAAPSLPSSPTAASISSSSSAFTFVFDTHSAQPRAPPRHFVNQHTSLQLRTCLPEHVHTNRLSADKGGIWTVEADDQNIVLSHAHAATLDSAMHHLYTLRQVQAQVHVQVQAQPRSWALQLGGSSPHVLSNTMILKPVPIGDHDYEFVMHAVRDAQGELADFVAWQYNMGSGTGRQLHRRVSPRFSVAAIPPLLQGPKLGVDMQPVMLPDFYRIVGDVPAHSFAASQIRSILRAMKMQNVRLDMQFTILNTVHLYNVMYHTATDGKLIYLAHATRSEDASADICQNGLKSVFSAFAQDRGRSLMGTGVYGALNVEYSLDTRYAPVLSDGFRHLFLCVAAPGKVHVYQEHAHDYTKLTSAPNGAQCVFHAEDQIFCFYRDICIVPVILVRIPVE